jgi:hypothetical protein
MTLSGPAKSLQAALLTATDEQLQPLQSDQQQLASSNDDSSLCSNSTTQEESTPQLAV